jgi:tetratricopeptide (TPR) repeat protein
MDNTAEIARLEQLISVQPEVLVSYWQLGLLHLVEGNLSEAQSVWLAGMMRLDPVTAEPELHQLLHLLLTEAKRQMPNRPEIAELLYQQLLDIQPDQAEFYFGLAEAVALQGRLEAAIELWQQAIQYAPNWAAPYRAQAEVWQKLGDWQQAIARYFRTLELQPDCEIHYQLGVCLGQMQQWQQAMQQWQQAVQLEAYFPAALADLGWAQLRLNQPQLALTCWHRALTEQTQFAAIYIAWTTRLQASEPDWGKANSQQRTAQLLAAIRDLSWSGFAQTLNSILAAQAAARNSETSKGTESTQALEFYQTTADWAKTQTDSGCYIPLNPPSTVQLTLPRSIYPNPHFSFRFGAEVDLPGSFVAQIPQGQVWFADDQSSTAILTAERKLLGELSVEFPLLSPGHPDNHPSRHSARTRSLLAPEPVNASVAVLSGLTDNMYFHWMFDVLPRLDLLRRSAIEVDYILVSHTLAFQQQTLELLDVPAAKILPAEQHSYIQATRLVVPCVGSPAWMPQWVCDFLRWQFLPPDFTSNRIRLKRLYISRQSASSRRLINELEVEAVLAQFGFQTVVLESLAVSEQAALLAEAEVVISLHGSGLTNIVFCQPGTKIIELFSPNFVYPCYWVISNLVGLEYYYLLGATPTGTFLHQLLYPNPRLEDVWIDSQELQNLLQLALA